jgi:hypothetical protein
MILHTEAYDPTDPDDRPKSNYLTLRDVKVVIIALLVASLLLWPAVMRMIAARDKHLCKDHLGQVAKALLLYAEDNLGRLPPLYVQGDNFEPRQFKSGANTWITLIAGGVRDAQKSFNCPAAHDEEAASNEGPGGTTVRSTYGMFAAVAAAPIDNIPNPSSTAMVAETANRGARDTYNPLPLKSKDGQMVDDGFVIGFDNSNFTPVDGGMDVLERSKFATRLAFYGTGKGVFEKEGLARHVGGIHILYADSHIETLPPTIANLRRMAGEGSDIIGAWAVR